MIGDKHTPTRSSTPRPGKGPSIMSHVQAEKKSDKTRRVLCSPSKFWRGVTYKENTAVPAFIKGPIWPLVTLKSLNHTSQHELTDCSCLIRADRKPEIKAPLQTARGTLKPTTTTTQFKIAREIGFVWVDHVPLPNGSNKKPINNRTSNEINLDSNRINVWAIISKKRWKFPHEIMSVNN